MTCFACRPRGGVITNTWFYPILGLYASGGTLLNFQDFFRHLPPFGFVNFIPLADVPARSGPTDFLLKVREHILHAPAHPSSLPSIAVYMGIPLLSASIAPRAALASPSPPRRAAPPAVAHPVHDD